MNLGSPRLQWGLWRSRLEQSAIFASMVEQYHVANCTIHLNRQAFSMTLVFSGSRFIPIFVDWHKLKVPKLRTLSPAISRADFCRKIRSFYLLPATHFIEDFADWRQLTFTNVFTRKRLALKNCDRQIGLVLLENRTNCRATWPTSNYCYIKFQFRQTPDAHTTS